MTPASSAYLETICWTLLVLELAVPLGLEEPPVVGVSSDVGSQGGGEGLAEEDVTVLAAFALVDPDLAGFDINFGNSDVAEFTDPDRREEQEPEHQGVLDVLGTIDDLIEPAELLGGQDTGQTTLPFFSGRRSQSRRTLLLTYRQPS